MNRKSRLEILFMYNTNNIKNNLDNNHEQIRNFINKICITLLDEINRFVGNM